MCVLVCRSLVVVACHELALATDAKALDDRPVTGDFGFGQVLQQPTTLPNKEQQPATAVVIMLMGLQVLGEVRNATREHRDLNLR